MDAPDAPLATSHTGSEAKLTNSLCKSELEDTESNQKMIYGLYAVYAAIGTVNGFFATYFNTPIICQQVFGPLGAPGRTTIAQCNVAPSVFQISWNFKLFLGFLLDNVSFFGSRRKGWLLFGWTGGLVMLAVNALTVESYINNHNFLGYLYSMMGMCAFYTFSDVAGDGLIIEVSKFEPDDRRGYIMTTCQMLRFTCMMLVTIFGLLFMSGEHYNPPGSSTGAFELPFDLPFNVIHWCLLCFALPSYAVMWICLKDPPVDENDEHHGVTGCKGICNALKRSWEALQSYAVFMLLIQTLGLLAFAAMPNPALQLVAVIANPSSFQNALGASLGNGLFVIGVWLFRKFLLTKNWRITLIWTYGFLGLAVCLHIMVIHVAWAQNGWFYMIQNSIPQLIQGLSQVLSCLAVIEISPPGLEATIYELLISAMNGASTLGVAIQTLFASPFQLDEISSCDWKLNHCALSNGSWATEGIGRQPECDVYTSRMTNASIMTLCVNLVSIAIFCWFMPINAAHCREWAAKTSWKTVQVGVMNLIIFVVPFVYANVQVVRDITDPGGSSDAPQC